MLFQNKKLFFLQLLLIFLVPNKKISALFLELNEITFIPFFLAWLDKKLKNLKKNLNLLMKVIMQIHYPCLQQLKIWIITKEKIMLKN